MALARGSRALFPEHIKQEIQALIAVNCREIVHQGKDAKEEAQLEKMRKAFHGAESHASLLKQFMEGKEPFAGCFDKLPLENNREGNQVGLGCMLNLKDVLTCLPSSQFIVSERGFVIETLQASRGQNLSGRSLNDECRFASANCEIALKFHNDCCPNGELPSGKSFEDALFCARQKMHVHLHGAKDQQGCNRAVKKMSADHQEALARAIEEGTDMPAAPSPIVEEDMPEECFFTGHFAFALFHPDGCSMVSLSCFAVDGTGVKTKGGRKEARKKEAAEKHLNREKEHCPDDCNRRGVSSTQMAVAANIAQREEIENTRRIHDQMSIACNSHQSHTRELQTVNSMLAEARRLANEAPSSEHDQEIEHLTGWKGEICTNLQSIRKRKAALELESDANRKKARASVLTNFINLANPVSPAEESPFDTPNN